MGPVLLVFSAVAWTFAGATAFAYLGLALALPIGWLMAAAGRFAGVPPENPDEMPTHRFHLATYGVMCATASAVGVAFALFLGFRVWTFAQPWSLARIAMPALAAAVGAYIVGRTYPMSLLAVPFYAFPLSALVAAICAVT